MIVVRKEKCIGCGQCAMLCPSEAFIVWGVSQFDEGKCIDCEECIYFCPVDAISQEE